MRNITVVLAVLVLVVTGCVYEVPLVEEKSVPIDESVLGLWQEVPKEGETADPDQKMLVLKYSDTQYAVHYPTGKDGMYFRAYPIKIDGRTYVQIQLIGTKDSACIDKKDRKYHVLSYKLVSGVLEISMLTVVGWPGESTVAQRLDNKMRLKFSATVFGMSFAHGNRIANELPFPGAE